MTITRVNVQTKQVETGIPYTAEEQAAIDAAIAAQAATVPAMVTRQQSNGRNRKSKSRFKKS
jgi:hypothetical protein